MNVIVIINDSFRRDHLGCYGNTWIRTPNLDRFAAGAAVFDQCYEAGPYRRRVRYSEDPPTPPLTQEQQAWATKLVQAAMSSPK